MRADRLGLSLFGLVLFAASASAASACTFRQPFFMSAGEGAMAHVRSAVDESDARTLYSNWCVVEQGASIRSAGPRNYFAINNRSDTAGLPRYFLVKVFRRSAATARNPLLSLRRSGVWRNARCAGDGARDAYDYTRLGREEILRLVSFLDHPNWRRPNECNFLQRWLAIAYGNPSLSLEAEIPFLRDLPERVRRTGVETWSINLFASAYLTSAFADRSAAFPLLRITMDGAQEVIVQASSGDTSWTFTITG